jgi:transmembrane sensor
LNSEQRIGILFKKYLANECSPEEAAELIDIIRSGEKKELIEEFIGQHLEDESADELLYRAGSEKVFVKIELPGRVIKRSWVFPAYLKIAAAVLLVAGFSYIAYTFLSPGKTNVPTTVALQDIAPGGNKAILLLSNGKEVVLSDMQVGNITEDGGVMIKKSADGQLAYFTNSNTNHQNAINTVKTPKGGQYQVILPDGSKVWLNAASSITYPAAFAGNERRVKLTGEGYFEITTILRNKKKVPFIVETGKQKIEVLGTRFNVNAYDDETGIKTTLIEGKVKVTTENETVILKPNQEFNLRSEGISTKKVDVEPAIDWKNGDFIFADEDIKSIMRKVARWYNVDVIYESDIPDENLSGQISRDRNLSEVLRMLELSGDTKLRIENGAVHIFYQEK